MEETKDGKRDSAASSLESAASSIHEHADHLPGGSIASVFQKIVGNIG